MRHTKASPIPALCFLIDFLHFLLYNYKKSCSSFYIPHILQDRKEDIMFSAINWHDPYTLTEDRVVYTQEQHHVPGIHTLAHHSMKNSIPSLKWHYHENSFEFTISTKGNFSFSTLSSSYHFSGGDVFISFPNEVHGTNDTPISLGELYWFQLDISNPKEFLFMKESAATHMITKLKALSHHVIQANAKEIHPLMQQAFYQAQINAEPEFIASYLQLFLHLVLASSDKENFALSPDIGRTLNYILDNITTEISLENLAELANLSCSQYKQKFKKQLGISPRHFINQQKIESSKAYLLEGMSITDIAMLLGFTTSSYFSKVFKKYTLYTPTEYLKKIKGGGKMYIHYHILSNYKNRQRSCLFLYQLSYKS